MNFKKKENVISEDSAREQLDKLLDYYGIDINDLPEEKKGSTEKLIKAIRQGRLEVKEENDECYLEQTILDEKGAVKEKLAYNNKLANAKMAMKSDKDTDHYGRMYSLMGSLCGLGKQAIVDMKPKDLNLAEDIAIIFLQ